ncbi:MAG: hypothetical protein Q8T08_10545, partial [Ignavibacteria bacterium]|nr:hypothetical protein [Ignavibacteria bacterium]
MKKSILLTFLIPFGTFLFAQMQTVQFNSKYLHFDNGKSLPAEQAFIINTEIQNSVHMVKMQLSNQLFNKNKILFESEWSRKEDDKSLIAIIPNSYKLKSTSDYNIRFLYYRTIQDTERQQIGTMLETSIHAFLKSNILEQDGRYIFSSNPGDIFKSLNTILTESMLNYEVRSGSTIPGYSSIIENMLFNLAKTKIITDSTGFMAEDHFEAMFVQLNNETKIIANNYKYVLRDVVSVLDYPTEKTLNTLSLNLGYAGIFNNTNISDLDYYAVPYLGVSFPLGNRAINNNFMSNASLSAGVF